MRNRQEQLPEISCDKCGYTWIPRKKNPKCCPECKSRDWNKDKKKGGGK